MKDKLKELNPNIKIYSIHSEKFKKYGKVLNIDADNYVAECEKIQRPADGTEYFMSLPELEKLACSKKLCDGAFGGLKAQIGFCHGHNRNLNGLEFHKCSEINIAVTPLVLLLGHIYDMNGFEYAANKTEGFYLDKGDAIELYATSLHFCPCQVCDTGFACVVILPEGTNDSIDNNNADRLLYRKNKWIICHENNRELISKGVYPGIHGENYCISY